MCLFSLSFIDCAKRGRPSGGKRDSIPPVILKSSPENFTTNFEGNEIKIVFDEFIKLVDIQKNLVISPPLKYQPIITPLNTSKQLRIKIIDTLKENTTYSFNFGKSIVDNNEGNEFPYYKYVFSTGSYIDSLTLGGTVQDAILPKAENPTSVLLYEYNESFTDSIILQEKPMYISVTQDSSSTFQFSNLKEGKYLLVALKEKNNDFIFQPKQDKIAFLRDTITLPTDSTFQLTLFKERPDYKIARGTHQSKNEIIVGFSGKADSLKLQSISEVPEAFETRTIRDTEKDTLHYWFKPAFDAEVTDSLLLLAKNRVQLDTLTIRLKNLFADSLKITVASPNILTKLDTFTLAVNTPIENIKEDYVRIINKDSTAVPAILSLNKTKNQAHILFEKQFDEKYNITLLPEAITDFFGATNDTVAFRARTKAEDDYGEINLTIENASQLPLIIELVNERFDVIRSQRVSEVVPISFPYLEPGFYYLRAIFDTNNNGIWDTGNFLKNEQPERVLYYNNATTLEVNGNWDLRETFILE